VMLVLLIIFMIVTPAITAGFQATIPRATNPESREEAEGEIRLGIDRDGKFYLDITGASGVYTGPRYISDEDLQGQLTNLYAARTVDKILFLKADEGIEFGRVQQAIEIARKAGVRVVGAIAEQQRAARPGEH
ncbi:MAG TPA: biopolymer transporter ExbD, partial [Gemmatimonadales bacterium]